MTLQEEIKELEDLMYFISQPNFQEYIAQPLRKEQEKIKNNFFSDSLKESWRKGGKKEGIELFFKQLKNIKQTLDVKRIELSSRES